ncbi:hypothetical protein EC991_008035 [Linnemannia zychae]|nr:hypothetical protein EC991_008035 [Linnemannia zychae]
MSNDITFLEQSNALDPVSFFKWKNYQSQEDKQRAHSAYASLITKEKAQDNESISQFWRALPKHSSAQRIQKIQTEGLVKNIKRLHSRDEALSETIDAGMIQAARSSIIPGASFSSTGSSTPNYQQRAQIPPAVVLEGTDRSDSDANQPTGFVNPRSNTQAIQRWRWIGRLDEEASAVSEETFSLSRAKSSPFYELAQYIFHKVQDRLSTLPTVPPGLSFIHEEMSRLALKLLNEPGDVILKKDVFVIISGIINTISPIGRTLLPSPRIEAASMAFCMSYESQAITALSNDHLRALYPYEDDPSTMSLESLQKVVYSMLAESSTPRLTRDCREKYVVLKILCQVLLWLEHDTFCQPVSEHVFVSVWSQVLNTMFLGGGLRVIPGELASKASKNCREITETEFGKSIQGAYGRKVDITIRVLAEGAWTGEIAVFECKPKVSDSTCTRQLNKSVRLNAAILLDLEKQGLDITRWFPIIAEPWSVA